MKDDINKSNFTIVAIAEDGASAVVTIQEKTADQIPEPECESGISYDGFWKRINAISSFGGEIMLAGSYQEMSMEDIIKMVLDDMCFDCQKVQVLAIQNDEEDNDAELSEDISDEDYRRLNEEFDNAYNKLIDIVKNKM